MPYEFPRYLSKGRATTDQPSHFAAENTEGQVTEKVAQIGQVAQDISAKLLDAQIKMKTAEKKVKAESGFMDTLEQAELDNTAQSVDDFDKLRKKYNDQIEKFRLENTSTSSGISGKKAALDIGLSAKIASHRVNGIINKKKIDFTRGVTIPAAIENYAKSKAFLTPGSGEWNKINNDLIESFDDWVQGGIITQQERHLWVQETNKRQIQYEIAGDGATSVDESWTLQELKKGEEGRYNSIDPIMREELINKALQHINQNKKFEIEQTVDNRLSVLKNFADGKIDWQNSDALIRNLTIEDPELGEAIKSATNTLFMPAEDDEAFAEATAQVFSASSREEIGTYLMRVLNANANREISRDRLAILINAGIERSKELKTQTSDGPATRSPRQVEIDSAVQSMLNGSSLFSVPNMVANFFNELSQGAAPKSAYANSVNAEKTRVNPLYTKYEVGDLVTNPQGVSGEVTGFNENGSPIIKRKK